MFSNYSIYLYSEDQKYTFLDLVRCAGARVAGVSGCGTGYYIQVEATPAQAVLLNAGLEELEW